MISEKTVEINITTELTNYLAYISHGRQRPFILSPSQPDEALVGYDVQLGLPNGTAMFIQYKRALPRKYGYRYDLNKTKNKDQHLRLFVLELLGLNVFYAFPLFHTELDVIKHRRRLLLRTIFMRPSSMIPFGSMVGNHYVQFLKSNHSWFVYSNRKEIIETFEIDDIIDKLHNENGIQNEKNIEFYLKQFNAIFYNKETLNLKKLASKDKLNLLNIQDDRILPFDKRDKKLVKSIQLIGVKL